MLNKFLALAYCVAACFELQATCQQPGFNLDMLTAAAASTRAMPAVTAQRGGFEEDVLPEGHPASAEHVSGTSQLGHHTTLAIDCLYHESGIFELAHLIEHVFVPGSPRMSTVPSRVCNILGLPEGLTMDKVEQAVRSIGEIVFQNPSIESYQAIRYLERVVASTSIRIIMEGIIPVPGITLPSSMMNDDNIDVLTHALSNTMRPAWNPENLEITGSQLSDHGAKKLAEYIKNSEIGMSLRSITFKENLWVTEEGLHALRMVCRVSQHPIELLLDVDPTQAQLTEISKKWQSQLKSGNITIPHGTTLADLDRLSKLFNNLGTPGMCGPILPKVRSLTVEDGTFSDDQLHAIKTLISRTQDLFFERTSLSEVGIQELAGIISRREKGTNERISIAIRASQATKAVEALQESCRGCSMTGTKKAVLTVKMESKI